MHIIPQTFLRRRYYCPNLFPSAACVPRIYLHGAKGDTLYHCRTVQRFLKQFNCRQPADSQSRFDFSRTTNLHSCPYPHHRMLQLLFRTANVPVLPDAEAGGVARFSRFRKDQAMYWWLLSGCLNRKCWAVTSMWPGSAASRNPQYHSSCCRRHQS